MLKEFPASFIYYICGRRCVASSCSPIFLSLSLSLSLYLSLLRRPQSPDFTLSVWDWRLERVELHTKAFGQDVYKVCFSPDDPTKLTTSGSGHLRFWRIAQTFTGLKLQGDLGKFGKVELSDVDDFAELPDGKVQSYSSGGKVQSCSSDSMVQSYSLDGKAQPGRPVVWSEPGGLAGRFEQRISMPFSPGKMCSKSTVEATAI